MAKLTSTCPTESVGSLLDEMCDPLATAADIIEEQFGIADTDEISALRDDARCTGDYKLAQLCTAALG